MFAPHPPPVCNGKKHILAYSCLLSNEGGKPIFAHPIKGGNKVFAPPQMKGKNIFFPTPLMLAIHKLLASINWGGAAKISSFHIQGGNKCLPLK